MRAERVQGLGQRVGRVGVVDESRGPARVVRHELHPAGRAAQQGQRLERLAQAGTASDREPESGQDVVCLEGADEAAAEAMRLAVDLQLQLLPGELGLAPDQPEAPRLGAEVDDLGPARHGDGAQRLELRDVGVDDGSAALGEALVEEPALGLEVGLEAAVIVEMVAADIGERGGLDGEPGEPLLVQPVARGLDHQMVDAALGELCREAVQGYGIGRGERALGPAAGALEAERAEAGGADAEPIPDLPREAGDRGLAVGAGDRRGEGRLAAVEAGGELGQAAARLRVDDDRNALGVGFGGAAAEHGHGALLQRLGDEDVTVGLGARERREELARRHRTAVGGDALDRHVLHIEHARRCLARRRRLGRKAPGFLSE